MIKQFLKLKKRPWSSKRLSRSKLLDYFFTPKTVFCGLGNTKFGNGLGWNPYLLVGLWIKTCARFPLLLHQLAKTG
jgi:hypothetical protein